MCTLIIESDAPQRTSDAAAAADTENVAPDRHSASINSSASLSSTSSFCGLLTAEQQTYLRQKAAEARRRERMHLVARVRAVFDDAVTEEEALQALDECRDSVVCDSCLSVCLSDICRRVG